MMSGKVCWNTLTAAVQWSPKQLLIGVITTLLGALLTFGLSWVHSVSATQTTHEAKIARLDERTLNTDKAVTEIKTSQLRIEDKLDRVLEGRH